MAPWRTLDHTADVGVVVRAASREALFVEVLRAMTDCITDLDTVRADQRRPVQVQAATTELLLVEWLGEALYRFDVEGFLAADATLRLSPEDAAAPSLRGELIGEIHDARRHPHKVAIKAITYHGLEVGPAETGWRAQCIFDI